MTTPSEDVLAIDVPCPDCGVVMASVTPGAPLPTIVHEGDGAHGILFPRDPGYVDRGTA